nr:MAG TPA: hypothetical protein [Ackermannviridae sp.]
MGIEQICNTITNFFGKLRKPAPEISNILLVCSIAKRKGLSAILSTANVVEEISKLGIPVGAMPDGSPNLTVGIELSRWKEIVRTFHEDVKIQTSNMPGGITFTGTGANGGGPMVVEGVNTNASPGYGILH